MNRLDAVLSTSVAVAVVTTLMLVSNAVSAQYFSRHYLLDRAERELDEEAWAVYRRDRALDAREAEVARQARGTRAREDDVQRREGINRRQEKAVQQASQLTQQAANEAAQNGDGPAWRSATGEAKAREREVVPVDVRGGGGRMW